MSTRRHRTGALGRAIRRGWEGERGYAIPAVVFLGTILVVITTIVIMRGLTQADTEVTDARFEQAFHAAEGGADVFLVDFGPDPTFTNHAGVISSKSEAIAAARAIAASDPSQVIDTPQGQAVVVKPDGEDAFYSVGFMPSIDDSLARVRVLETSYDTEPSLVIWTPTVALLFNKDATVPGQVVLKGKNGSAHSNGDMSVSGRIGADDCVTSSGSISAGKNKIAVGPGCPEGGDAENQIPIPVPDMEARDLWVHSEFQLCPGGDVRAGPAHVTGGPFAGDAPCKSTASLLGTNTYRGWTYRGASPSKGALWEYTLNQPRNGAYYVYQGSALIATGPASWKVSLVAEAAGTVCNKIGGDLVITGNIGTSPYGGADPVAFFADRDMEVSGNKNTEGLMFVKEQLLITGNPAVNGSFTMADECNSPGSPVAANRIDGNPTIRYDADDWKATPWYVPTGPPIVSSVNRGEL